MTTTEPVFFNPLADGYMADPFPHFREIREADPVHYTLVERWALFAYDDVFRLLRDPALSVDDAKADFGAENERVELFESIMGDDLEPDTSMLNTDPPDHTRLRRLVSKAFTPATIEKLRPMVQEMVTASLDRMAAAGGGDLVAELAFTLPFDVISEMLGMPGSDKVKIRTWSEDIVKTLDPILTEDEVRAAHQSSIAMNAHLAEVIEWKRANPADDLLTKLIEAEEDGDRLSPVELRDQVALLFIAGHETTVNLIGTGIYELLRSPDQLRVWRENPDIAVNGVDELLRYVSPVQISRRIATTDLEFGGKEIAEGSFIMAVLASANRDPAKFGPDADVLDLHRDGAGQHVSFGSGAHYCLGASLAKLEAQVAIGSFVERFGHADVQDAAWNGRINLRGLERLDLAL
ncbi:MAG: cytochrome P450 [Actinomycetota bacterium]